MSKEKVIRILLEIPERWVDIKSPTYFLPQFLKQFVEKELRTALVEQYVNKVEMPEIKIAPEEVKDRMLTILAERALEKSNE